MTNYLDLARHYYDRKDYEKVCDLCDRAALGQYDLFLTHELWGEALLAMGRFRDASSKFMLAAQAPTVNENSTQISEMLFKSGSALARAEDYEEAARQYMSGIAISKSTINVLSKLIETLDLCQAEHVLAAIQKDFKGAFQIEITDVEELSLMLNGLLSDERAVLVKEL
jgi:tetratricopeptide (TPR) repeat protein